jgi:hypothetical protein
MSGGGGGTGGGGSGQAHEASPNHQGPPPAAAGSSHMIRCNDCGYMAKDGGDLDEHMRKEHFVRAQRDISVPAALIFIDALGDTIPFKASFTFKELSDFCRREGVSVLAPTPLTDADLIKIAENIGTITQNHVQIEAQPTRGVDRDPISAVDLSVASKSADKQCMRCQAKIASYRIFCDDCRIAGTKPGSRDDKQAIRLYAHVTLRDGASLHVVEIGKETLVGVDDFFVPRDFTAAEVVVAHDLEDDLRTVEASSCDMCGEEVYDFSAKCANCGAPRG